MLPAWADDVKRNILRGTYEAPELRLLARWIGGDRPVVELGGAFGVISAATATRLAPGVAHVVVEANPLLVDYCRRNATSPRGSGAPTVVVSAAVAYGRDRAPFVQSDAFLGSRLALAEEGGTVDVATITLSQILETNRIELPYDLVCDIEGAELEVLRHDADALAGCRIALIELHPDVFAANGSSEAGFLHLLDIAGFEVVDRDEHVVVARNRQTGRG